MDEDKKAAAGIAAVISAEVLKALIMIAFQELRKKGMTAEEIEAYAKELRAEIDALDPAEIPEV